MFIAGGLTFLGFASALYFLRHYLKDSERKMTWWKWAIAGLWGLLVLFAGAVLGTFIGEGVTRAVFPASVFFGVILLISGIIVYRLVISGTLLPSKKK